MTTKPDIAMTLEEAVGEVLTLLTGMDLHYNSQLDRFRTITRTLNRALRANALEKEWSYYSDLENVGTAEYGQSSVALRSTVRPRIVNDDAVRLVDDNGTAVTWAYFLPRDAIHKYPARGGLWVSSTRQALQFSRPFTAGEAGLQIMVPVMREPRPFVLPRTPEIQPVEGDLTDEEIVEQLLDFAYPDLIVARAAHMYAQTDPVMQPRAQTLEAAYKDLMYQVIERDDRNTDSPFLNDFFVPVENGLMGDGFGHHYHPHSDERR